METSEPATNGHGESISLELLTLIRSLGVKAQAAKSIYDTVIQEVSVQYTLADGDSVDLATGKITRAAKESALH